MPEIEHLRKLIHEVPIRLEKHSIAKIECKPSPSKWSPKEELGHLLDSAANNHQRIVRTQLQDNPAIPGYDGNRWVELHCYQQRNWREMVDVWRALNQQLLAAAEAVPNHAWTRTCTIADSQPLTLKFVFEDYVDHMLHHLSHIGIDVNDLKLKTENRELTTKH